MPEVGGRLAMESGACRPSPPEALRNMGSNVVVGGSPDMGTSRWWIVVSKTQPLCCYGLPRLVTSSRIGPVRTDFGEFRATHPVNLATHCRLAFPLCHSADEPPHTLEVLVNPEFGCLPTKFGPHKVGQHKLGSIHNNHWFETSTWA